MILEGYFKRLNENSIEIPISYRLLKCGWLGEFLYMG
jgi:hypothetical protein